VCRKALSLTQRLSPVLQYCCQLPSRRMLVVLIEIWLELQLEIKVVLYIRLSSLVLRVGCRDLAPSVLDR
jgi:hypothetical protein